MGKDYLCEICNKEYKSYMGYWKHNNKYHNNISQQKVNIKSINSQQKVNIKSINNQQNDNILLINEKKFPCKYCDKNLSFKQSKWIHEQKCKIKYDEINNYKIKIKELENKNKTINITNNNLINNNNIINITNIGTENIHDLTKYEKNNICNSNLNALTTLIDNMFFNYRLPNNHKLYNSSLNDKHINVIENNKIVKKKKTEVYDIMFTPCVKMIESIVVLNKKNIQDCKEIIEFYYTMPIHKKLMKAYHDEVNLMSYNKKDLILNTWNKILQNKTITEEESNIVKQSIEELKNSNEEFESSSDDYNSDDGDDNNDNKNIIPGIYIKKNNKNNIIKVNQDSSESDE